MDKTSGDANGLGPQPTTEGNEPGVADECTAARLRTLLEGFSTGVAIVTTAGRGATLPGVITTSFSSVSLQPPSMMWSVAKRSSQHDAFRAAREFTVHLLDPEHSVLAKQCAGKHLAAARVTALRRPRNRPVLFDCRARLDCQTYATHDGGDFTIIAAWVASFEEHPGERLLFHRQRFGYILPLHNAIER